MILINNFSDLQSCLLSDTMTGRFVTPVSDFVKSGEITKVDNRAEFLYAIDDLHTINFQLNEDIITFKGYNIKEDNRLMFHRPNNLPATLYFLKNGKLNSTSWFVHGNSVREHPMQPIKVQHNMNSVTSFQYAQTNDHFFEMSHLIYDKSGKGPGRLIDMMGRIKGVNVNCKQLKELFALTTDVTFDDCYDLSKNIFTDDQITLLRMIEI